MHISTDTPTMTIVFTHQDHNAVTKTCLLFVRTALPSTEKAVVALTAALTQWIKMTPDGREFLETSRYAVSIADLAATNVFQNELLHQAMLQHGLEFVGCDGVYAEPNIDFDRSLVDTTQLPEVAPETVEEHRPDFIDMEKISRPVTTSSSSGDFLAVTA